MKTRRLSQKHISNYQELANIVNAYKTLGKKIVCTIGSWDMLHIGHLRYLERAKNLGDILIVGVDSDKAIKIYKKNPFKPIIPHKERIEMLTYQEFVDYVTLIDDVDKTGYWQMKLIQTIKPDVFVVVAGESYSEEQRKDIAKFCGRIHVLPRQAKKTSTTNIVEKVFKGKIKDILSW
ncbi:MAG: adenylyltransferase/cytidyltransferase family protein [bacterium]